MDAPSVPTLNDLVALDAEHDCTEQSPACVRIVAVARLPTRFGDFHVVAFDSPSDKKEHAALVHGNVVGKSGVPVRLHSECLTGDAFTSLRCDCREQLERALEMIGQEESGIVLYLRQEGRGIGFANKIRAYQLQEKGYDTLQANELLGFRPDERDYVVAAHMLQSLRVRSIRLMSNNPAKVADLAFHGVQIDGRIPIVVPPNPFNARYLETKRLKAGHFLDLPPGVEVPEQLDSADVPEGSTPSA
ncbi:MAG TPA: GTP cyclohydrolase II [Thermoplasmata archaeon]|nr:GTP cyclohydrolase II [Thermoplasmata archaeon]